MRRAIMVVAGSTETRPRSVIFCMCMEDSEKDHSAMANRGSSTTATSLKSETIGHTLTLLSSFSPQMPQNFVDAGSIALHCRQRSPFTSIRFLSDRFDFILSGSAIFNLFHTFKLPPAHYYSQNLYVHTRKRVEPNIL